MNVDQSGEGLECPSRLTNAGSMLALSTVRLTSSLTQAPAGAATLSPHSSPSYLILPGASVAHCRGLAPYCRNAREQKFAVESLEKH